MLVTIMPEGKQVQVKENTTLLEALQSAGVLIESPCGGNKSCGKCKVLVTKGNDRVLTEEEQAVLTNEEVERGIRLACCFLVNSEVTVMAPRASKKPGEGYSFLKEAVTNYLAYGYSLAIDVGTTTVEIAIINRHTARPCAVTKFFNPQSSFGADVISRITYCVNHNDGERKLHDVLVNRINEEVAECLNRLQISTDEIKEAVIVCNTTMSYLLTNTKVTSLSKAPFSLEFKGDCYMDAKTLGFAFGKDAKVYIPPNIGGHVGSDAYACMVSTNLFEKKGRYLLIDVGTNGEIILSDNEKMYACSTAAGPAFEGAGISCGMKATSGAITKAVVKENKIQVDVMGNVEAEGISGSGIIDLLACMLQLGWIDDSGYIKEEHCFAKGFEVTKNVYITRDDVRQIQLAKAAIYAGIMSLLKIANMEPGQLDEIYIAGAFGSNINIVNAMGIGLLPDCPIQNVKSIGNAAIEGAFKLAMDRKKREETDGRIEKIKHVELAELESFQDTFIMAINFRSYLF